MDEEARALATSPELTALLAAGRASPAIRLAELDRRRPLTEGDKALADEYLAAFERLEAEQDAEVTDVQAHLLNVVLIAARSLRGDPPKTLADREAYTGIAQDEIRAAAVGLQAAGLEVPCAARPISAADTDAPAAVEAR